MGGGIVGLEAVVVGVADLSPSKSCHLPERSRRVFLPAELNSFGGVSGGISSMSKPVYRSLALSAWVAPFLALALWEVNLACEVTGDVALHHTRGTLRIGPSYCSESWSQMHCLHNHHHRRIRHRCILHIQRAKSTEASMPLQTCHHSSRRLHRASKSLLRLALAFFRSARDPIDTSPKFG